MEIIIGILAFALFIYIFSIIQGRHWLLTGFWLFFGIPICGVLIIVLFKSVGIRWNTSTGGCEVEYSRSGPTSVICDE